MTLLLPPLWPQWSKKNIHQTHIANTCLNITVWLCLCVIHQVIGDLEVQDVRVFLAACPGELNVSYCPAEWLFLLVSLAHSLSRFLAHSRTATLLEACIPLLLCLSSLGLCYFFVITTISHMIGSKYPNLLNDNSELFEHMLKPKHKDSLIPMFSVCQQREFYPSSSLRGV